MEKHNHITSNSKKVKKGSIFVSINNNDKYINEAINNGASLIVSKNKLNIQTENKVVENIEYYFSYWYKKMNEIDINNFKIIAVTGTDGKTTTAKMIYDTIMERFNAIYIGTLGIIYNEKTIVNNNTTPDIETILETLLIAKKENIKYIIIEASSEGLLAKRLIGIHLDVLIFTNLTREHLNTHITMESYFKAKCIALKLMKKDGKIITNIDCPYGLKLSNSETINYGLHKGNVHTLGMKFYNNKTKLFMINNNRFFYYEIPFLGTYNIYNFLATHACINYLFNINLFSFNNIKPIPGRFLNINNKVIIDFAHTPNALENLLLTIKNTFNKKIILILGSQGEKDKGKRVYLGMVADKYCDKIILTSEDPKCEPVLEIIYDISQNIINHEYTISLFRKHAIDSMLESLNDDYIGVVVGKGLEETEKINNVEYKYSDYLYIKNKV